MATSWNTSQTHTCCIHSRWIFTLLEFGSLFPYFAHFIMGNVYNNMKNENKEIEKNRSEIISNFSHPNNMTTHSASISSLPWSTSSRMGVYRFPRLLKNVASVLHYLPVIPLPLLSHGLRSARHGPSSTRRLQSTLVSSESSFSTVSTLHADFSLFLLGQF